jgi:hypothetical protein
MVAAGRPLVPHDNQRMPGDLGNGLTESHLRSEVCQDLTAIINARAAFTLGLCRCD